MTVHYNPGDRLNKFQSGLNVNVNQYGSNYGRISTGESVGSILLSVFGQAMDVAGAAVLQNAVGGGGGSKASDNSGVTSAKQQKTEAEIGIKTTQAEIDRLTNEEYISDDDYNKQKTDLEEQMKSLDTTFKMNEEDIKSLKTKYESAKAAYEKVNSQYEQALNIESQMSQLKQNAPITSTGKKLDPEKDGTQINNNDYTNKYSDQNAKNSAMANDKARADQVHNEWLMLKAQRDAITNGETAKDFNTKTVTSAKNTMNTAKTDLNNKMEGSGNAKVEQYYSKKTDIENQIKSLELKHENSAATLSAINTLKTQLSDYKTKLSTANEYLNKVSQADNDVASAKTAKKGAKDGNFFSRLFNKKQRATRKYYNQQIAEAKQKRADLE